MMDWSAGYVADIGYTYGVYTDMHPLRIKFAFLAAGLAFPEIGTACELGFGQGMSINAHAAASITEWHGTDFNPGQVAFAQDLAKTSGSGAKLWDQAFAEFCSRDDLPDFDYICLHGIWSWVSDENRTIIVDFLRRKLKVGGVLYISYNTLPGLAPMVPVRDLLSEHSAVMSPAGAGTPSRVASALDFMDKLMAADPRFVQEHPGIKNRYDRLRGQNAHYLAHEYFNRDWAPMPFSKVASWLEPAKLSYACSADFIGQIDSISLTPEQSALLTGIENTGFRQTVRDFMLNQQFRKDYWIRGARRIDSTEQLEQLAQLRVVLVAGGAGRADKVQTPTGERTLSAEIYGPILEMLADHRPHTLGEILEAGQQRLNWAQLAEAISILIGMSQVFPAQEDAMIEKVRSTTRQLNHRLCRLSQHSDEFQYLVSPVTGTAIGFQRFHQLFAAGRRTGLESADQMAAYALHILFDQGQRIVADGKSLDTREDNLAALQKHAEEFLTLLPKYRQLELVD
jgi:hypothetical protein